MLVFMTGLACGALAGVVIDAAQVQPTPTIPESMRDYFPPASTGRPIQAAIVIQRRDCAGNLRMFDLLHRRRVRDRIALAVIWYAGPVADSTFIRTQLPEWTRPIALRPLPHHVWEAARPLGHVETPTLVVLDQGDRLRFISRSPRSPREFAGLARIIEGLTWVEEL